MKGRLVAFVCPVVDSVGAWPGSEAAIGKWAWFAAVVEDIDEALRGEVNIECEMH